MPVSVVPNREKMSLQEEAANLKAQKERLEQRLAALDAVRAFPDAERLRYSPCSESVYGSRIVHEIADKIDPSRMFGDRYASGFLYTEIATPHGPARVYSTRPVDLVAGFEEYAKTGNKGDLVAILKGTTRNAEAALVKAEEEQKAERAREEVEYAENKRAEMLTRAQPVVIVSNLTPNTVSATVALAGTKLPS